MKVTPSKGFGITGMMAFMLEFESLEKATGWFTGPEYAAVIEKRDSVATFNMAVVEGEPIAPGARRPPAGSLGPSTRPSSRNETRWRPSTWPWWRESRSRRGREGHRLVHWARVRGRHRETRLGGDLQH